MKMLIPKTSPLRSIIQQWAVDGVGIMVAILFFILVGIIVVVATASSKSPWDTVIAALAMISQAGFAYMVYRLGREQYAFAQQVATRQHKIDMFPLWKTAADRLEQAGTLILPPRRISYDDAEEFRLCHLEINKLFSDKADEIAFELSQEVQAASHAFSKCPETYDYSKGAVVSGDAGLTKDAFARLDNAIDIFTDLQSLLDDEMRIT